MTLPTPTIEARPHTSARVPLCPLIISAPFGNYIQPAGATATLGTFTAARRPGRLWRVLRTVRWYPRAGAWINQIGLRNPGIDWLARQSRSGRIDLADKIVSIHGFSESDWHRLIAVTAELRPLAIELNMSCPNVGHINWPGDLFERAQDSGIAIIVKIPPVNYSDMVGQALDAGIRTFHCCNTIPVPNGGVSGKPLKPFSIRCIADVRQAASERDWLPYLRIIGGGGITTTSDIDDYVKAGASHIAIGTKAMNPFLLLSHGPLRPLIDHAARALPSR